MGRIFIMVIKYARLEGNECSHGPLFVCSSSLSYLEEREKRIITLFLNKNIVFTAPG